MQPAAFRVGQLVLRGQANEAEAPTAAARSIDSVVGVAVALDLRATAVGARVLDDARNFLASMAQSDAPCTRPLAFNARYL